MGIVSRTEKCDPHKLIPTPISLRPEAGWQIVESRAVSGNYAISASIKGATSPALTSPEGS